MLEDVLRDIREFLESKAVSAPPEASEETAGLTLLQRAC